MAAGVRGRSPAILRRLEVVEEAPEPSDPAGKLDMSVDDLGIRIGVEHHRGPSPEHLVVAVDKHRDVIVKLLPPVGVRDKFADRRRKPPSVADCASAHLYR